MITTITTIAHMLSLRIKDERGATAVEYGLMVALIAVVIIAAVAALGGVLNTSFADTCAAIDGAAATPSATCPKTRPHGPPDRLERAARPNLAWPGPRRSRPAPIPGRSHST